MIQDIDTSIGEFDVSDEDYLFMKNLSQFVLLLLVKFVHKYTFLRAFACIEICS